MAISLHFGVALTEKGNLITWGLPYEGSLGRIINLDNKYSQKFS